MKKVFLLVLVLFVFLFSNVLGSGYILDDHSVIENREELRSLSAVYKSFLMPWHQNQPQQGNFRPLTLFSYFLTLSFSESTAVMRFINLIIHAANAALIFYLINMFYSRKMAYFVAVGFALLPINTGTVLSLVGRSDLLSAFFVLLSAIFFFKEKYIWSVFYFFLALLSKEFSIFLLPATVLLSIFFKRHKFSKVFKISLYYCLALVPYFFLRYLALGVQAFKSQSSVDPIIGPLAFVGLKERILTGFAHFYFYLRKTFIPIDLSPDYSFNQIPIPRILSLDLILGLILFFWIVFVFFKSNDAKLKTAIILFLVPFGVISNVFFVTTGTFAERWWYFPSIGLVWFVSAFIKKRFENKKLSTIYTHCSQVAILVIGIFYLYVSFGQAKIWTNERRLFVSAAERSPNSVWARTNLAAVYFKEQNFYLAKREIDESLKILENYPAALNIKAKLLWQEGRIDEAESAFKWALENDLNARNNRDLYRSLAILKLEAKNYTEAKEHIEKTINSQAFGDIEKAIYLDNLLLMHIEGLLESRNNSLSDQEKNVIKNLIDHIKGF
ncbi:MAG: hypothetical protein HYW77_03195 [Parcubacteria group bacterium]|nr:hypothetical protein [Parcubacteria group bacterium]